MVYWREVFERKGRGTSEPVYGGKDSEQKKKKEGPSQLEVQRECDRRKRKNPCEGGPGTGSPTAGKKETIAHGYDRAEGRKKGAMSVTGGAWRRKRGGPPLQEKKKRTFTKGRRTNAEIKLGINALKPKTNEGVLNPKKGNKISFGWGA